MTLEDFVNMMLATGWGFRQYDACHLFLDVGVESKSDKRLLVPMIFYMNLMLSPLCWLHLTRVTLTLSLPSIPQRFRNLPKMQRILFYTLPLSRWYCIPYQSIQWHCIHHFHFLSLPTSTVAPHPPLPPWNAITTYQIVRRLVIHRHRSPNIVPQRYLHFAPSSFSCS
jgi:hypothetical protein